MVFLDGAVTENQVKNSSINENGKTNVMVESFSNQKWKQMNKIVSIQFQLNSGFA